MKKFIEKLERMGAAYKVANYGENYFPGVPEVHYQGIQVKFNWEQMKLEKEIRDYLKRRKNLVIFSEWHNLTGHGFVVAAADDRQAHEKYRVYMDASIKEWEIGAHDLYTAGHPEKVNGLAKNIMEKWEKEYKKSLFTVLKKAV